MRYKFLTYRLNFQSRKEDMGRPNSFFPSGLLYTVWLILTQILGISCLFVSPQVRLVDGSSSCSGRVQVLHSDEWQIVCYDGWDLLDGNVVCGQLGCGEVQEVKVAAFFGPSLEQIWMNRVNCVGNESSLADCAMESLGPTGCLKDLYAGVICQPRTRLVSGINSCSGRVEVFHNGLWGTVCDDYWGLTNAAVVCRELGCGDVIEAKSNAYFAEGSGQILMDDVNCSRDDNALSKCEFAGWGVHNCVHSEDAGVVCQAKMWLFNNFDSCSGTVAVFHNASWGAVCADDDWDLPDATVVCREIGCWKSVSVFTDYSWSSTPLRTWMNNVSCSGDETALSTCAFQGWGPDNCDPKYAGVICRLPVRLTGGRDACSGLVEVFHDGQWGTVNADGWDLADAAVVCREMGCGDAVQATGGAFGRGIGPIWMTLVDCVGSESSLIQCSLDRWLPNHVNHLNDAGVVCTHSSSFSISSTQDSSVKVLLRIKVKTDARFNPNNPKTLSKITEMQKKLQISGSFSLTWKTQEGGKVFKEVALKKNVEVTCH